MSEQDDFVKGPMFSIIVPEHNSAEFMRRGLDSIKAQTFQDYELIIVCDKCDDNTEEIAAFYINDAKDKFIVTDCGRCAGARNAGLDVAIGEWILFMDDDDWWSDENAFQKIADRIREEKEEFDILAFGFYWQNIGYAYNRQEKLYTAVWNKAWRREFIERIGARFPDWAHSDDEGFSRITHKHARIRFMKESLYYYNWMRPGSLTWQIENKLIDGTIPAEE